ncbi:hypothetical protein B0H13DRAFT_1864454 [Mycena leptocephala]|nr:hypothetical protein B0H13DRAFT_1864454 [Mycena leptocephala]
MVHRRRRGSQAPSPSRSATRAPSPARRNPPRERRNPRHPDSPVSFAPPSAAQQVPDSSDDEAVSTYQQQAPDLSVEILDGPPSHNNNTFDSEDGLLDVNDDIFNDDGRECGIVAPWKRTDYSVTSLARGPVAMMLFPDPSALAIFGSHSEDKMVKLAQKLANISNFPVIARPAPDDPMFYINIVIVEPVVVMTVQIQDGVEGNIRNVSTADNTLKTEGQTFGARFPNSGPDEVGGIGSVYGTNRHGGNPGDEGDAPGHDDKWEDWVGPMHTTRSVVNIQANKMTLPVKIV